MDSLIMHLPIELFPVSPHNGC